MIFFLQQTQIHGLPGDVNRFSKKNCHFRDTTRRHVNVRQK